MANLKSRIGVTLVSVGLLFNIMQPADAATQKVSYYINGDCSDYYDEEGEYAFFEEEVDWSCYITVFVKPVKPQRQVRLQYWSGTKWKQESSAKTSSAGKAYLYFDPYCYDGSYCEGEFKYRVIVDAGGGQKTDYSDDFYINYYPYSDSSN